jgi:D-alanyl-D-alanine carboxypeptidase/D-alanyl-D-alanine-endopeptidase (penicillin-binding protein 4)
MRIGRLARQWLPPALLGIIALVAWQAANRSDFGTTSVQAVAYDAELATPMLSARRTPLTLRAPVSDGLIVSSINQILLETPSDQVCLMVRNGDRILGSPREIDGGLVPASNQKLLTTFTALEALGPDFTFNTRVAATVPLNGGVVNGDLYFIGDGDPFLFTADWLSQYEVVDGRSHTSLEALADAVVATGLTTVTGSVIGDESLYDSVRYGPWDNRLIVQKQSGPLSALTVNEGFNDWPEIFRDSFRPRRETSDPPVHSASVFAGLLQERGVSIGGAPASGVAPPNVVDVASIQSPSLLETVTHINTYSSNLGAELLLKRLGLQLVGQGTTEAGASAMAAFLTGQGIPMDSVQVFDGSGLSEANRLTCRAVAEILARNGPATNLGSSLSVSGQRGTLAARFIDTPAVGLVRAKTGTLRGVQALSGYVDTAVTTDLGSYVTFSYIINDDEVIDDETIQALQAPFLTALTGYPAGPAVDKISPLAAVER